MAEGTKTSIFNTCCLLFICTLGMEIWAEMKVPGTTRFSTLVFYARCCEILLFFFFSVPGNLGCYKDHGNPPPLTGTSKTSNKLTIQNCIQFCRSQRFKVMVLWLYIYGKDGLNAFCWDVSFKMYLNSFELLNTTTTCEAITTVLFCQREAGGRVELGILHGVRQRSVYRLRAKREYPSTIQLDLQQSHVFPPAPVLCYKQRRLWLPGGWIWE